MAEWWSYTLSDLLLFSPRTYRRLFELYNADIWPAQLVALALGAAIFAVVLRQARWRERGVAGMLALCWLWIAGAFHIRHYATINWAASYFAAGFAIQALLLARAGFFRDRLRFGAPPSPIGRRPGDFSFRAAGAALNWPSVGTPLAADRAVRRGA